MAIYLNYVWMSQLVTLRTSQSTFWSMNQLVIKKCVCRMVWGLVGYGCRLAVLAHGFGVGHSGSRQAEIGQITGHEKMEF